MPYLPTSFLDEEQAKANALNVSGPSGTTAPGAPSASAPKPVKNSGSWTNLNSYLDANKDNAQQMGTNVATKITDQGAKTSGLITDSKNDFTTKADAGTISNLSGAKDDATAIVGAAKGNVADNQITSDQINRFKDISNAAYKGPADLSGSEYYAGAAENLTKANNYKNAATTDEGRFGLLQEFFARPTYSQGQKNLDNLLIQGNSDAKNAIQGSAQGLAGLQGAFDDAQTYATTLAGDRTTASNDANAFARSNLISNRTARTGEVDADIANIQNQWSNEYNDYNQLLSGYDGGKLVLTPEQAAKLNLTKGSGQGLYNLLNGVPASNYLDLATYDANKVVSKDQFAQLAALDQLAKQFGGNSTSKYSNKDDAGKLSLDNNFSASRFGDAANVADANFNQLAANTNINGTGYGHDAYSVNFGLDNKYTNASATIDANLAEYLANQGYTSDGSFYDPGPDGAIGAINEFRQMPLNAVSTLLGGDESQAGSAAIAKQKAEAAAQASFMSALNEILANEGFDNRVSINDIPKRNSMLK